MLLLLLGCTAPSESPAKTEDSVQEARDSSVDSADSSLDSTGHSSVDSPPESAADSGADSGEDSSLPYDGSPCSSYLNPVVIGRVQDESLNELSGLAVSRLNPGILWSHEDSGGAAELVALDFDGNRVATLMVEGVENEDWEDLALFPSATGWALYIADIGDRGVQRSLYGVLRVEEPILIPGTVEYTVVPEVFSYTFPGDPEDAEALVVEGSGLPVILTKRTDATAGVYRFPTLSDGVVLDWLGDVPTGAVGEDITARATAADLWPDGSRLVLRSYFHLWEFSPAGDLAALPPPVELSGALEFQGEAVAYDPLQGGIWQLSEGIQPALNYIGCDN